MASKFLSITEGIFVSIILDFIQKSVEFVAPISIFGYTIKDLPFVSRLMEAVNILAIYDDMQMEMECLQSENDKLHNSVDELKGLNNSLRCEVDQFKKLRENLEKFAVDQNEDFVQIMKGMNENYDRINGLLHENERVLLMKVAQDIEFLDHNEGMCQMEYERFVDRIPQRLHQNYNKLLEESKYSYLKTYFDKDPNARIPAKTMQNLINDLCDVNLQKEG